MKKNILTALVVIAMLCAMIPIEAVHAESMTAAKMVSEVLVDGVPQSFQAYTVKGNNYFKLRDVASVLNGTSKQFEVAWNSGKNAITLTTGQSYTTVGSELQLTGGNSIRTAAPADAELYLDGERISLTAYHLDGSNYFKLRDRSPASVRLHPATR